MTGYKFKAKDKNGNWIFGNKINEYQKTIRTFTKDGKENWIDINLETLCTNSGRCDKNGNPVFSKDILLIENKYVRIVEYSSFKERYLLGHYFNSDCTTFDSELLMYYESDTEILGNTIDNKITDYVQEDYSI